MGYCTEYSQVAGLIPGATFLPALGIGGPSLDDLDRRTHCHTTGGNAFIDDTMCADYTAVADLNTGHDDRSLSNPYVVPDLHRRD